MTPPLPPSAGPSPRPRLVSVDALRGFDMFWIVGGEHFARALDAASGNRFVSALARQLTHVEWEGCHFFDVIFPLFLFLIGVSIVFSLDRMRDAGDRRAAIGRIGRRSALLFVIGIFYYGGVSRTWPDVQLMGVLPRIALCYGFGALLYLALPRKAIAVAAAILLLGYWALLAWVPFPDVDLRHATLGKRGSQSEQQPPAVVLAGASGDTRGRYEEGRNLVHYVDYRWLPGRKRNLNYTNEGLLSTLPAIATTLLGILAGMLITSARWSGRQKSALLIGGGLGGVALGFLWGLEFPVIKRIWTSSFCLVTSGWSAVLLGLFYYAIDVLDWKKWCRPFVWIGSNALVIYLVTEVVDFSGLAARLLGGDIKNFFDSHVASGSGTLLVAAMALVLPVLLARYLYQKKIFIRL